MAYRRPTYRRTRRSIRRYTPRKTYSTRRTPRPTYRRKRRVMSKKRILNISSTKKRDVMLGYSNVIIPRNDANTTYTASPAFMQAVTGTTKNTYIFAYCPTARASTTATEPTDRNSQTCYMRGVKERIELATNTGIPWQWRRICYTKKGPYAVSATFDLQAYTSNGYVRMMNQVPNGSTLFDHLFEGGQLKDWNDFFAAKVNNKLVTLKYDKTVTIQSGNSNGVIRSYRRWHPMNHNLVYGDEENGGDEATSYYSTLGKPGMGDYYIVDIFQAGPGGATTDQMSFNPQATLYWHEK